MSDAAGSWTEERVELLGRLWQEGLSASQIAAQLGGGVTRNAVIGKVHRLGLAGRAKTATPAAPRPAKARPADPAPAQAANNVVELFRPAQPAASASGPQAPSPFRAEAVDVPVKERVSIAELRDGVCRWPLGDPTHPDFGFCGGRAAMPLPYCAAHCRIAYQPAAERRRLRV